MTSLIDFILHIDVHLDAITRDYGAGTYLILCIIVFCETGLVIAPILPGDSLLFAAGAIASRGILNPHVMALVLIVAAVVGDGVNYWIGSLFGPKILHGEHRALVTLRRIIPLQKYMERTEKFFDKYGGKAVVFARFVPIVRTFAPFLAGIGKMSYPRFLAYNIVGGVAWVLLFVYAGFFFGEHPKVKENFTLVIFAIIFLSILPPAIEFFRARREGLREEVEPARS